MATLSARIKLLALSIGADIKSVIADVSKLKTDYAGLGTAASRNIGTVNGNVPEYSSTGLSGLGYGSKAPVVISYSDKTSATGFYRSNDTSNPLAPISQWTIIQRTWFGDQFVDQVCTRNTAVGFRKYARIYDKRLDVFSAWAEFYTTLNTTKDANGFIKAASPIVRVFADKIETNADAESQDIEYIKNGVGDYTLNNTTGLSTDGWHIELPKDMNGNPKVAIGTLDDTHGVITLKTYKRIFDMTTFKFVPDLEQPLDIPDGRWIDLRFNDFPVDESVDMPANNEE